MPLSKTSLSVCDHDLIPLFGGLVRVNSFLDLMTAPNFPARVCGSGSPNLCGPGPAEAAPNPEKEMQKEMEQEDPGLAVFTNIPQNLDLF